MKAARTWTGRQEGRQGPMLARQQVESPEPAKPGSNNFARGCPGHKEWPGISPEGSPGCKDWPGRTPGRAPGRECWPGQAWPRPPKDEIPEGPEARLRNMIVLEKTRPIMDRTKKRIRSFRGNDHYCTDPVT
mgnify:CR=1 FL=1